MHERIHPNLLPYTPDPGVVGLMDACVGRILRRERDAIIVDKERLRHIADWLRAAIANDEPWLKNVDEHGRPKKLMKFGSIDAIVREADKAMLKAAQKLRGVKLVDGDEELVETLQDGYYVVRLLTPTALDRESAEMQHCIGNGAYDDSLNDGRRAYLSLRDPQGKAHVTMEVSDRSIVQLQGKQNTRPIRRYIDILIPYIRASGLAVGPHAAQLGHIIDIDGVWHPFDKLPEGLTVEGNLDLSDTPITKLPDGMTVKGDLDLSHTPITELPKGMTVGGFLFADNTPITDLPEGLTVEQGLHLSYTKIFALPEGLKVNNFLHLSYTPITALPEGLTVGCNLHLCGTPITTLPKGLKVGGHLNLCGTPLTASADRLAVDSGLRLDDASIFSLPDDLSVGGRIIWNHGEADLKIKHAKQDD